MRDIADPEGQWRVAAGQAFYRCPFFFKEVQIQEPVADELRRLLQVARHAQYQLGNAGHPVSRDPNDPDAYLARMVDRLRNLRDAWHEAQRPEPVVAAPAAAGWLPSSTPQGPVARFRSWWRDMSFHFSSLG